MTLLKPLRKTHKILSYFVFVQVTLWLLGGAYFALMPFQSVVKGGDQVRKPAPLTSMTQLSDALKGTSSNTDVSQLRLLDSAQGPLLRIDAPSGPQWFNLGQGQPATQVSANQVARFAERLYIGTGQLAPPHRLQSVPDQLGGLVQELKHAGPVWMVVANDPVQTRLYFDGQYGHYLTSRNQAWVWFDALWRLHVMDYDDGEDFNNPLLILFSITALLFALSGCALAVHSLKQSLVRRWRRLSRRIPL
ncbi:hypothetical protein SAMN04488540_10863 [Ferrimonas sediminum]|uniref:PepSY-associated TM region n=1 Tax=Ferrimonas sediminum TaxID=718193 RepID=A0A1G8TRN8_9GAMM|nr:hypothetical protein [Ferrimonas sediminum]SDJ44107.1 hypothetical protein SAMN04488540_10863 [Ferrimonas sediminum]